MCPNQKRAPSVADSRGGVKGLEAGFWRASLSPRPRNQGQMHIGLRSVQCRALKDLETGENLGIFSKVTLAGLVSKKSGNHFFCVSGIPLRASRNPKGLNKIIRKAGNVHFHKQIQLSGHDSVSFCGIEQNICIVTFLRRSAP